MGTLSSTGIPMAISLVSKISGSGLQLDRQASNNTRNVCVPPLVKTRGEGHYPLYYPPPFFGSMENPIGAGVKKSSKKAKGLLLGPNSPFN